MIFAFLSVFFCFQNSRTAALSSRRCRLLQPRICVYCLYKLVVNCLQCICSCVRVPVCVRIVFPDKILRYKNTVIIHLLLLSSSSSSSLQTAHVRKYMLDLLGTYTPSRQCRSTSDSRSFGYCSARPGKRHIHMHVLVGGPSVLKIRRLYCQFSLRWYQCACKSPYALLPVSQKFLQRCLRHGSSVRLIGDGPVSSFEGRSSLPVLGTKDHTFDKFRLKELQY